MRQSDPMTTRRDHRQTHVRPRPPSTGRPAPVKVKPRAPGPDRLSATGRSSAAAACPMVVRFALVAAVLARRPASCTSASAASAMVAGGIGSTTRWLRRRRHLDAVAQAGRRGRSATRRRSSSRPSRTPPNRRSTSSVTVPSASPGSPTHRIRVYLTLPDQPPTAIQESPIAATPQTDHPGRAEKGINDFTVIDRRDRPASPSRRRWSASSWTRRHPRSPSLAEEQRRRQRQGGHDQGQDPGADDAPRPQRRQAARRSPAPPGRMGRSRSASRSAPGVNDDHDRRHGSGRQRHRDELTVRRGSGQADRQARGVGLPGQALEAAGAHHPVGDGDRPGRQAARRRRRHVHAEHPGHPDGDRSMARPTTNGKASFSTTIPKGADTGPGQRDRPGDERGVRVDRGLHGHHDRPVTAPRQPDERRRAARHRTHSQLPSGHADVALSALRDTPGRDGQVLGLPPIQHRLRHLSELPPLGRRPARLLRARS